MLQWYSQSLKTCLLARYNSRLPLRQNRHGEQFFLEFRPQGRLRCLFLENGTLVEETLGSHSTIAQLVRRIVHEFRKWKYLCVVVDGILQNDDDGDDQGMMSLSGDGSWVSVFPFQPGVENVSKTVLHSNVPVTLLKRVKQ